MGYIPFSEKKTLDEKIKTDGAFCPDYAHGKCPNHTTAI